MNHRGPRRISRLVALTLSVPLPLLAAEPLGPPLPVAAVAPRGLPPEADPVTPRPPDRFGDRPRVDRAVDAAEAVRLALTHSPILAAMAQDVEMARQMLAMARARTLPMVSANGWATYGDAPMIVSGSPGVTPTVARQLPGGASLDANFMAMAPLYTGGALGARVAGARNRVEASAADLAAMRLDLALEVASMVHRLEFMRAMIGVTEELVRTAEERVRLDQAALAAGRIPELYLLQDQAELASARQQRTNANRDYRVMLADLRATMGIHPLSALEIADQPAPSDEVATSAEADLDTAARQRPELSASRARILGAEADTRAASAAFQPQVAAFGMADFFANRMNDMDRFAESMVGLSVSLPLFDGGERLAEVRRARAERARLTAGEQELALRVAREVLQARERLAAARENVTTAEAALTAARENYRLAQLRYQAGRSTNVEVLEALRMRTEAETNHRGALLELAVARDEWRRAVGDPALLAAERDSEPAPASG